MTLPTLLKFNFRYYMRHSLLSLLCLLGIALGVGIVVAVELINDSALTSFASSIDFLSGRATHSLISGYGHIDEDRFVEVWKDPAVEAASPVVQVMATAVETGPEPIRFLGLDPFLDADFRKLTPEEPNEKSFLAFVSDPVPGAYLSARVMKEHGLKAGDKLTVVTAGIDKPIRILGQLPDSGGLATGEAVAVMDISAAQEVFGRPGYLDRIDIIARRDIHDLQSRLHPSLRVTDANERKTTLSAMLRSFQLNLAAMSLLALFVGIFLIYNFSMFSVLARRQDMSLLLTLGADRRGLVGAFLTESVLLATAGSVLGILFGYAVAWFSVERVSSTITELYFYVHAQDVHLTLPIVLSGLGVGFVATIVGTGLPALEVSVTPPILGMKRQSIEDRAHGLKSLLGWSGAAFFAASLVAAWASRYSIQWGFLSAFGMTFAFALFTPCFLSPFTHWAGIRLRNTFGSLEAFLAARTIRASLSRTSTAVAALAVALAMTIGVDTMIFSFRESVSSWLDGSLQGDLYVSPATTKWDHPLPEALIQGVAAHPGVAAVERYSTYEVYLDNKPVRLRVVDAGVLKHHSRFRFLSGNGAEGWDAMQHGGVFVSESLAYRFGLKPGMSVTLPTPAGEKSFPIVGVVRDYSSDQGTIHMDRAVYEKNWHDRRIQSLALFLKPGVSRKEIRSFITSAFPGLDRTIASNTQMRRDILVIFDKTFAPTATLKGVSLLVALLGVATALMAILMERSREMTVLGYLGLTPHELGRMNVYQALIMGLVAFAIAVACGLLLTYIIIYAINYRSFGWSIDVHVNPWVFAKAAGLTLIACLCASIYPTYKLVAAPDILSLKEE
jgi:putative ABC transport system permease protein